MRLLHDGLRQLLPAPHQHLGTSRSWAAQLAALAAACGLAMAVRDVWLPLQLVGATAGAALICILPGALSLSLAGWRLGTVGGSGGVLLVCTGLLLAAAGIAGAAV